MTTILLKNMNTVIWRMMKTYQNKQFTNKMRTPVEPTVPATLICVLLILNPETSDRHIKMIVLA